MEFVSKIFKYIKTPFLQVFKWSVDSLGDFACVPKDVIKVILSKLNFNDLIQLNRVCKGNNEFAIFWLQQNLKI